MNVVAAASDETRPGSIAKTTRSHAVSAHDVDFETKLETSRAGSLATVNLFFFYMQTLPTGVDVDNMWEGWKQRFNAALDEVAPRVTKAHSHRRRHCPWMTKELLNLIHKQKSLHRRIVKSAHKNPELIARHRALRNKTNNLNRRL